ncbi:hypothetical protein EDC17_103511 [Sphingobacterium alimentarium]|uniref:DUF4890 domain-containing protein n=1 Tax=Sphingobacterium alimentarium TaxID=797292 RepID=A0A4R3VVZ0_9SPHI|nr:hypothetical protein [Sphingobacterium alimentarium]TCV10243.1 hypothetical protein EDC17_103511 [Sphingobacterium alimentarium]
MKKFLSLAILLSGISFASFAQEEVKENKMEKKSYVRKNYVHKEMVKLTPEQIAEKRTEQFGKDLNLTAKQREEVYKLHLDQAKEMKAKSEIRNKERAEARKERMAHNEKFMSVLTPEQQTIWKEKFNARAEKFKGDREGKKGHRRDHKKVEQPNKG